MPKINRNLVFLGVAILLGAVAAFMAVRYVNRQVAERTRQPSLVTRTVVVPVRDLVPNTLLTPGDVATRDVPADLVPADAITPDDYERYMGQMLRAPLAHGAPISSTAVESVADHFSRVIKAGHVAYTMQVDETNSVSGMIVPGDHVDILMTLSDSDHQRTVPLLGDVLVLATGQKASGMQPPQENAQGYSNITLELAPRDAQRITIGRKVGDLRILLRRADSDEAFDLKTISEADLLRLGRRAGGPGIQFIIGGKG